MGDQQKKMAGSTFYSLGRLAHYLIIGLGILFALLSLGFDLTTLALVAGALSVGIGFGLQGIVNNFLSGLIILFEGQLKVGDFLELESGWRGVINAINMRSTVIRTNRGIEVLIPNAEIIGQRTINWTMTDDYRRIHVPFGVAYKSDKELIRKVVLEAADRVPHTVKGVARYRDPVVWLTGFGDNALNFELVVWVSSPASSSMSRATADYYWEIHSALIQNNIEIPYPQRDIHLRNVSPEAAMAAGAQKN
jgi:small-conductance mechanosensitive channel